MPRTLSLSRVRPRHRRKHSSSRPLPLRPSASVLELGSNATPPPAPQGLAKVGVRIKALFSYLLDLIHTFYDDHHTLIWFSIVLSAFTGFFYAVPSLREAEFNAESCFVYRPLLFISICFWAYLSLIIGYGLVHWSIELLFHILRVKAWLFWLCFHALRPWVPIVSTLALLQGLQSTWKGLVLGGCTGKFVDAFVSINIALLVVTIIFAIKSQINVLIYWNLDAKDYLERAEEGRFAEFIIEILADPYPDAPTVGDNEGEDEDNEHNSIEGPDELVEELGRLKLNRNALEGYNIERGNYYESTSANLEKNPLKFRNAGEKILSLRSKKNVQTFSKHLFKHIDRHNKGFISFQDFLIKFPSEKDAERAFLKIASGNRNDEIVWDDMYDNFTVDYDTFETSIFNIRNMRFALMTDLQSSSSASFAMKAMVAFFIYCCTPFIAFGLLGVDINTIMLSATTLLISFSFAFGTTISRIVEAAHFLFITKPFQVGDRITLGEPMDAKDHYIVQEINLLSTACRSIDRRMVFHPNHLLANTQVVNLNRLPEAWVFITLVIGFDTTEVQMLQLKSALKEYLGFNKEDWKPSSLVFIHTKIIKLTDVCIDIAIHSRHKWQDGLVIYEPQSRLLKFIQSQCQKLGIRYKQAPLSVDGRLQTDSN